MAQVRTSPGSSEQITTEWQPLTAGEMLPRPPRGQAAGLRIIAVDGRGLGGKSTPAGRPRVATGSAVVHTDDVAWNYSMSDWAEAPIDNVLQPVRAGQDVRYRAPGRGCHQREQTIDVPAGTDTVFVERVCAGCRDVTALVDAIMWVQSGAADARDRGIARDVALGSLGDLAACRTLWEHWTAAELPCLQDQRPRSRAGMIAAGTGVQDTRGHNASRGDEVLWDATAP